MFAEKFASGSASSITSSWTPGVSAASSAAHGDLIGGDASCALSWARRRARALQTMRRRQTFPLLVPIAVPMPIQGRIEAWTGDAQFTSFMGKWRRNYRSLLSSISP
jgi:hypothetical protein